MKRKKNLDPNSPEVINAAVERIRRMTPEEKWAFLTYRTPGVEMTDMTGMFGDCEEPNRPVQAKRRAASA
jgi:hypothetical protein